MRQVLLFIALILSFKAFGQRDVTVYTGTLYWVGRATAAIDVRVSGTTYSNVGSNSWYHPDNWSLTSGGSSATSYIPGTTTNVIYDQNALTANCTIGNAGTGGALSGNANVCGYSGAACPLSFTLNNGYTGTISFSSGWELFIGTNGKLEISAGALNGNNDRIYLGTGADFTLTTGGSFTLPSASKLEITNGDFLINGGTFTHNNSTVAISGGSIQSDASLYNLILKDIVEVNSNLTVLNHLSLNSGSFDLNANTINVGTGAAVTATTFSMGNATLHSHLPNPSSGAGSTTIINGTIDIQRGNLYLNSANTLATFAAGSGILKISGSSDQTLQNVPALFGTTPQGCLPTLRIDKPGGTLYLQGLISARGGWQHAQGLVSPGTSTVYFRNNSSFNIDISDPVNMSFNHLIINRGTVNVTNKLSVNGDLTIAAGTTLDGGDAADSHFFLKGNFTNAGTLFPPSLATVYFNGTGTQTINVTGIGDLPAVEVSNGSVLTMQSNVTISNDLYIQNGGQLSIGSNHLYLKGNWLNDGTFNSGLGTVHFSGTSLQTVDAALNAEQVIYSLETINPNGIELSCPVTVTNSITLTTGIITTSNLNILTVNDGASINGANTTSYINGPMIKIGNDYPLNVPIGKGSRYAPIQIFDAVNTLDSDILYLEYFDSCHPQASSIDPSSALGSVSQQEYWNLTQLQGSPQANLQLSWNTWSNIPTQFDDLVISNYVDAPSEFWTFTDQSFVISGTQASGNLRSNIPQSLNTDFTIGSTGASLPVLLISFNSENIPDDRVLLVWKTAMEINNKHFILMRSFDGLFYDTLAIIQPLAGTWPFSYHFIDNLPYFGRAYYKLLQADIDGKITMLRTIAHLKGELKQKLYVYPTDAKTGDTIKVIIEDMDESIQNTLWLLNISGYNVMKVNETTNRDGCFLINTAHLIPGVYIVKFNDNKSHYFAKFILR